MNWNYPSEIILLVVILTTTIFHAQREAGDKPPVSKLFHLVWFLIYCAIAIGLFFIQKNWWFILAAGLEHAVLYNQILNLLRDEGFFYVHGESENGSVWDIGLEKLGKFYPVLWVIAAIGFVFIQVKL